MLNSLKVGANIKLLDLPQSNLNNKEFTVYNVSAYKFKNACNTTFGITGDNNEKFLLTDISDEVIDTKLAISLLIHKEELGTIFDLEEFALIFSNSKHFDIHTIGSNTTLDNWLEPKYTKDFDYVRGEHTCGGRTTNFHYYTISAKNSSVDIEVFDHGETLFYITTYLPYSSITIK